MSSKINKFLVNIGQKKLSSQSPLYQSTHENREETLIDLLEKCLKDLTEEEYWGLLKFLSYRGDIAMSLILFYEHDEIREKYKYLPIIKQFQMGMRHFCTRSRCWSKRDSRILHEVNRNLPNPIYPNSLPEDMIPDYKVSKELYRKHRDIMWMPPYKQILPEDKKLRIWFLNNELLESLIFAIKSSQYDIYFLKCTQINHPRAKNIGYEISGEVIFGKITNSLVLKTIDEMSLSELLLLVAFTYYEDLPHIHQIDDHS